MDKRIRIVFLLVAISSVWFLESCSKDEPNKPEPIGSEWIDPEFARVLEERGYIKDANTVTPSEIVSRKEIIVSGEYDNPGKITSLKGLEYFTSLQILYCNYNQLTQLDVSRNTELTDLYCYGNKLTQLDVSRNLGLKVLDCNSNQLTQLDVSRNAKLESLKCCYNPLTRVDVSSNTELEWLACNSNKLEGMDISKNLKLKRFICYDNPGINGLFKVRSWFDNTNVPESFYEASYYMTSWDYNGATVKLDYYM